MEASSLIGRDIIHTTDPDIVGKITDIVFGFSLSKAEFFLADVTTKEGHGPLLFSPSVLTLEDDVVKTGVVPEDISARVQSSMREISVAIDPSDLPSTLIGPFGNTISPSLMAALFNARKGVERPDPPTVEGDGIWFTELSGHAVRAHVGDIGTIKDVILDDHLSACTSIVMETFEGMSRSLQPAELAPKRNAADHLSLSLVQADTGLS